MYTNFDRYDSGRRTFIRRHAEKLLFCLAVLTASLVTAFALWRADVKAQGDLQRHLAGEVLRFHVLANSDSSGDQELKLKVRDAVLDYLEAEMPEKMNVDETADWVRRHVGEIGEVGEDTVRSEGYDYPVNAAVTTCFFPDKTYGDVMFPAGNYEALRVEIGAAKGKNWWCVLYPNLCFLDTVNAVVPEEGREKLKNVLTEEEYSRVTAVSDFKISWFFRD